MNDLDILCPVPEGRRNADDMGFPTGKLTVIAAHTNVGKSLMNIDREQYERELKERQEKHLERVAQNTQGQNEWRPCMHDQCTQCHGTGIKSDGTSCVHMISCPCPRCHTVRM